MTLDELEKAFLKDAVPEAEYTEICDRSLKQYKSILADETVAKAFVGLEEFKAEWEVCSALPFHTFPGGPPKPTQPQAPARYNVQQLNLRPPPRSSKFPAQQSASALACRPRP